MALAVERLEPRDALSTFVLAGGVGYAIDDAGRVTRLYGRLVEPESRDVPFQVAVAPDGHSATLGAGAGGGPRVIGLDLDSGAVTFSAFVGDPTSRSGVGIGWLPDPPRILAAAPDPTLPGDPAGVQAQVDLLPAGLQRWVVAGGGAVDVFAAGHAVTDLPQFAALRGVETGAAGDGTRAYDQVPAVTSGATAYLRSDLSWPTLHELGHVAEALASGADRAAWLPVWRGIDWGHYPGPGPADYFAGNQEEGFAESFHWWAVRSPALQPSVVAYFDSLAAEHGWGT